MLKHKWTDRICCIVLCATLLITCLAMGASAGGWIETDHTMGYENRLFDQTRVHTIDIVMDDWDGFLENCTDEQYVSCSVVIDGEAVNNVGIRAKGNTSLSSVAAYGNNRYSFKIEFDQYVSGKSYYGLDKLSLNNLIQDNTYMKDFLAYTLMGKMGVAAPLCSYAYLTVNGQDWGLYLAVEAVEDAFLQRNYGKDYGELYKPDSLSFGAGRGNGREFDMDAFSEQFTQNLSEEQLDSLQSALSDIASGEMPEGFDPGSLFGGEMPGDFDPGDMFGGGMPGNFDPGEMNGNMPQIPETGGAENTDTEEGSESSDQAKGSASYSGRGNMGGRGNFSGEGKNSGGMGGGMGSSDVKLQYIDDDPASYSNIFDNAKTDITEADQARLIEALKNLSAGENIESTVDVEAVIRYFAVHDFLVNGDSYTGSMIHNYYLYEKDGQLSMIPWDYNLAFGGFSMGGGNGATSSVNSPIDSPVSSGELTDRPMVAWIFADEEYTALYHEIYAQLIENVFDSGWFDQLMDSIVALISPYVEKDPTAFCSYEEFESGASALREFCLLRAQSVSGQLDGSIPATEEGQNADSSALIDASQLSLSDMGSMGNMGGGGQNFGGKSVGMNFSVEMPDRGGTLPESEGTMPDMGDAMPDMGGTVPTMGGTPGMGGGMPGVGGMPSADGQTPGESGQIPGMGTNMPGMNAETASEGAQPVPSTESTVEMPQATPEPAQEQPALSGDAAEQTEQPSSGDGQRNDFAQAGNQTAFSSSSTADSGVWLIASILLLAGGLVFAIRYRPR